MFLSNAVWKGLYVMKMKSVKQPVKRLSISIHMARLFGNTEAGTGLGI